MSEQADKTNLLTVAAEPCRSCPYRRDVPSGIWSADEYEKLKGYDGPTWGQSTGLFMCHQKDGQLCAGWVACHGTEETLAFRMHGRRVDPSVADATFDTPVFASGAEAAEHGMREFEDPGEGATRVMRRIIRKRLRRAGGTT